MATTKLHTSKMESCVALCTCRPLLCYCLRTNVHVEGLTTAFLVHCHAAAVCQIRCVQHIMCSYKSVPLSDLINFIWKIMKSMSLQERHNYILKKFIISDKSFEGKKNSYDIDIIKEHHRFLWDDNELSDTDNSWEICMARRYYNKLFKEYCIADLTLHKENKVALRWRTKDEVVLGKGQFQCGSRKCEQRENLSSWEVNFAYHEQGENKNALVKLRLCAKHSKQLNSTSRKREVKRLKKCSATKGQMLRKNQGNAQVARCFENTASEANEESETENRIWNRRPNVELEQPSREIEFERYLEDLLL